MRILGKLFWLTGCCFLVNTVLHAKELTLVKDGRSEYRILVEENAFRKSDRMPAGFAAKELQSYLQRVTGVTLPIVHKQNKAEKYIIVGNFAITGQLNARLEEVKPEGFIITTRGDDLILMGRDTKGQIITRSKYDNAAQTGTLYAVYEFLERFCGVRWFMPGELGEVVPHRPTLTVPANINIKEEPGFMFRWHNDLAAGRDSERTGSLDPNLYHQQLLWLRRNKCGHSLEYGFAHAWHRIMPLETYYELHPEYFALVRGIRTCRYRGGRGGGQLCTSNPEVVAVFSENLKKVFEKRGGRSMTSIAQNDSSGECECSGCQTLDPDPARAMKRRDYSERFFAFYNAVGREVYRHFPDRRLGVTRYGAVRHPPAEEAIYRNISVLVSRNGLGLACWDEATKKSFINRIVSFSKATPSIWIYSAYWPLGLCHYPTSTRPLISYYMPLFKKHNVTGLLLYQSSRGEWGGKILDYYLLSKFMWDPALNVDETLDDFYSAFYGKETGKYVRQYHDALEKGLMEGQKKLMEYEKSQGKKVNKEQYLQLVYGDIRNTARNALDNATAAAKEEKVGNRVKMLSDAFSLAELTMDATRTYAQVKSEPNRENVLALKSVIEQREELLERNRQSFTFPYGAIRSDDTALSRPSKAMVDYLVARLINGKRAVLHCQKPEKPPVMDGKLTDKCWGNAETGKMSNSKTGKPSKFLSEVSALYDEKNLYLAYLCVDPAPEHLDKGIMQRDGDLWRDNEIEAFLDVNSDRKTYFLFIANSIGTRFDVLCEADGKRDLGWNAEWTIKTEIAKDRWTAEIAIPLKELGINQIRPGEVWRANFHRTRRGTAREYNSLFPPFGSYHDVMYFGELIFK